MSSLFSWINALDGAALTAGDQVPTLPVANLADRKVQKVWRSGSSYSTWFGADLRAATSIGIIGLFGCGFGATDTVRIRLSNVSIGGSDVLDTGAVASGIAAGYGQFVYVPNAPLTARYVQVDINAASLSAQGYFDLGRAWIGATWAPGINFSMGYGEQWNDPSNIVKSTRSGAAFVDPLPHYRTFNMAFDWLSATDRTNALAMERVSGRGGQILFVPDTAGDLTTGPLLGRLSQTTDITEPQNFSSRAFSKQFTLEQDL